MRYRHLVPGEILERPHRRAERRVRGPTTPPVGNALYDLAASAGHQNQRQAAPGFPGEAMDPSLPEDLARVLEKDSDLRSLEGDSGFELLVAKARSRLPKGSAGGP